jgi:hypothetical protein
MGTRSTIALEFADGTVEQVYCHWDGYLAHNGQILLKHYSNPFILRDLIDLGDISSLKPTIGTKHAFSHFELRAEEVAEYKVLTENMTTFYGRDRGETGTDKKSFVDFQDYLAHHQYEEYDYILRNVNGKATWFVSDHDGAYVELEQAIMDEQDSIAQEETAE